MANVGRVRVDLHEVPKPGGGVRVLSVLDTSSSRRYADLVAPVPLSWQGAGEGGFGVGLASRGLAGERAGWARAVTRAVGLGVAIRSDVRSCFPSIGPEAVGVGLSSVGVGARDVEDLQALLRAIACVGTPGLPVGPTPSAVVAETVLRLGDVAVRRAGGTVVRWVDDVVIAGPDRAAALRAFDAWTRCLRDLGLEPHDGKTDFLDGSTMSKIPSVVLPSSRGMMRAR